MIPKGDLQDIDAFIGSKHGKYPTTGDTYLTNEPPGTYRYCYKRYRWYNQTKLRLMILLTVSTSL